VLNAGLFSAIREAGIFSADPDIGLGAFKILQNTRVLADTRLEIDNPKALANYYELLLAILKVITAIVLSQGPQNDQTISQARHFLEEYRSTIVSIFKRCAGIGGAADGNRETLESLVNNFTVLISAAGFLDVRTAVNIVYGLLLNLTERIRDSGAQIGPSSIFLSLVRTRLCSPSRHVEYPRGNECRQEPDASLERTIACKRNQSLLLQNAQRLMLCSSFPHSPKSLLPVLSSLNKMLPKHLPASESLALRVAPFCSSGNVFDVF